ncbi:beta-tubulin cofactor d [Xylariales sp. AK1849]|nr:beta-tubulin cofactor d [Xylariales sp. AK1849]
MDASESDRDVLIQRSSGDLIADFDRSLGPFLRRPDGQIRKRVRVRETSRLVSQVLEPFQELPQLLDPHLPRYLPLLAEAYLEHIQDRRRGKLLSSRSQLLAPLSNAICRIIYAFCKIRGEKVIVRFLSVETRFLELLLLVIEDSERLSDAATGHALSDLWTWHERYVVLLWLSQLFFAPFDLSTISSGDTDDADRPSVPGFQWPMQIPGITLRVIPLGLKYLSSPGKERDGAKALLVRLAMRKDMQEIGILKALVQWALFTLRPKKDDSAESPYYYIGSLSLLAGILRSSADTSIMDPYLSSIFYAVQAVSSEDNTVFKVVNGSALARKTMIKVVRSVITLVLRKSRQATEDTDMVENSIGYLLESLSDNDTPVRLSASKALSIITLKLEPDMALQVVEAVLESLNRNVLWVKTQSPGMESTTRDLTAVDPSEWHGLMLTLSHLLYRRSPPPESLSHIIHALIMGLAFEKRGTSGTSTGTNVRDAACFGIWALARRYTTAELLQVSTKSLNPIGVATPAVSILQIIATDLVVAASLDPAGNIRRGSSAALQELIGRHPDTIKEGIAVVQAVDYHTVALRSRAIHEVALQATRLSSQYGLALLAALLGWRGIGDMDTPARRVAASSFGTLTAEIAHTTPDSLMHFTHSADLLLTRLSLLQVRQVEERHGLLLSLAAVFDYLPTLVKKGKLGGDLDGLPISRWLDGLVTILKDCCSTTYRKPELIAEAVSKLVVSSIPIYLIHCVPAKPSRGMDDCLQPGDIMLTEDMAHLLPEVMAIVEVGESHHLSNLDLLSTLSETVDIWLNRNEVEVMEAAANAAVVLLLFSTPQDRSRIIQSWANKTVSPAGSRNRHGNGYFYALTRAYHVAASASDPEILNDITKTLTSRWMSDDSIETRVAILQSLTGRDILRHRMSGFAPVILGGLDDYTTNARGDVGSHVRLGAIKATKTLWEALVQVDSTHKISSEVLRLFPKMLRLAAEKLDRVRTEAQTAVVLLLAPSYAENFSKLSFSSKEYFVQLFGLCDADHMISLISDAWTLSEFECISSLLAGLSTSADTGNEDLVIASRAAVAEICRKSIDNVSKIYTALIHNLKLYQGQDRVVVPTLELIAYLFHIGVLQRYEDINLRQLCLLAQKAGYKSGNIRKIEACIKVYGGVVSMSGNEAAVAQATSELELKRQEGLAEAKRRLGALLIHPWPRVRSLVVDELWGLMSGQSDHVLELLSVDWGRAEKTAVEMLVMKLGFN